MFTFVVYSPVLRSVELNRNVKVDPGAFVTPDAGARMPEQATRGRTEVKRVARESFIVAETISALLPFLCMPGEPLCPVTVFSSGGEIPCAASR